MTWPIAILYVACVVSVAINGALIYRTTRRLRRILVLDQLLGQLCAQACGKDHAAIWRAWEGTMGEFEVVVTASRWDWTESSDPSTVGENPGNRGKNGDRPRT